MTWPDRCGYFGCILKKGHSGMHDTGSRWTYRYISFCGLGVLLQLAACPPYGPTPNVPPDADAAPAPIIDAAPLPPPPVDAATCMPKDCCAACAGLTRAGCGQSDCVQSCVTLEKFSLIKFDTTCLGNANTAADVVKCGVACPTTTRH